MQTDNKLISNKLKILIMLTGSVFMISSCSSFFSSNDSDGLEIPEWLINEREIVDGGPGIDGIPSIENPQFANVQNVSSFQDDRRITGLRVGNQLRAYPHQILDHHEIVNHEVNGISLAVTFCPLTGTSIGVERNTGGTELEYGVSGLLFRNNLVIYDRNTGSAWSQMQLRSVGGDFSGTDFKMVQLIETSWATWREMYPDSEVMTTNTGFNRDYNIFVYGADYTTNHNNILFPIRNEDNTLQRKQRVHTLLPPNATELSKVKAYLLSDFGPSTTLLKDEFMGEEVLLVGNSTHELMNSFKLETAFEQELILEPVDGELPIIMRDQHGNSWDIFGYAVDGPNQGERLTEARAYTGFWFALADFYPDIELYIP